MRAGPAGAARLLRLLSHVATCAALACASSGCTSAPGPAPVSAAAPFDSKAQAGEAVFIRNCNGCHPGGEAGVGPALNDRPLPDVAIKLQIRTGERGRGRMPAFPPDALSDEEIEQIIAFLARIRRI